MLALIKELDLINLIYTPFLCDIQTILVIKYPFLNPPTILLAVNS